MLQFKQFDSFDEEHIGNSVIIITDIFSVESQFETSFWTSESKVSVNVKKDATV